MTDTLSKEETPPTPHGKLVAAATTCCGLEQRLMSLSENAKSWLAETCERFADSQEYSKNEEAIQECLEAELIRKRRYYIEISADVMDMVYSQKIFGHKKKLIGFSFTQTAI
jgi:hypothetical protein